MMLKKILLVMGLFLSGCGAIVGDGNAMMGETDYHRFDVKGEDYYFQYPKRAVVVEGEGYVDLSYLKGCGRVYFGDYGDSLMSAKKGNFDVNNKRDGNRDLEVWYKDGFPVFDRVTNSMEGVSFWLYSNGEDISSCMETFDFIVDSFTDEPRYSNDKFSFSVKIPDQYELLELPSGDGVLLRKDVQTGDEKVPLYSVGITFLGVDNLKHYENVADYVGERYPGYTVRFKDYGEFSGFFVDESANMTGMAVSHFYTLGKGKSVIYQADLEVPSKMYNNHMRGFEDLVASWKFY